MALLLYHQSLLPAANIGLSKHFVDLILSRACPPAADVMDFSEDGLRVVAGVVPRRLAPSKPPEKNSDTLRRIFSAHKKVKLY